MSNPVEQFLGTDFAGPAPTALRQALLAKTARVLRRRRWRRRLAWAGALAACFVAGMGTMTFWRNSAPPASQEQLDSPVAAEKEQVALVTRHARHEPPPSLLELEWRAFDSSDNRAALFFAVARRYFEEQHDFDSALRCYRQALDVASKEDLAIRPDDNWLVMALKEARQKETDNAIVNR